MFVNKRGAAPNKIAQMTDKTVAMLCILLGSLAALVLTLVTPPLQTPDEHQHFARAYQVSDGSAALVQGADAGAVLPASILELTDRFLGGRQLHSARLVPASPLGATLAYRAAALEPERRAFAAFSTTVLYPPVSYWPQAGAIALVRAAGGGPLAMLFGSRAATVVATTLLVLAANALLRRGNLIIAFVFTLPMTLFVCASAAPDGFVLGAVLVYLAIVARVREDGGWTGWGFAAAVLCAAFFSVVKPVYGPLLLLPAFAMVEGARRGRAVAAQAALIGIVALCLLGWGRQTRGLFVPPQATSDIPGQIAFILANPAAFIRALIGTMVYQFPSVYRSAVGYLGWLNVPLPLFAYAVPVISAALIFLARPGPARPSSGRETALWLLLTAGSATLVYVAMYVYWTRVGLDYVQGVQGRYMLPLVPVAMLAVYRSGRRGAPWRPAGRRAAFAATCALSVGVTVHTVARAYSVF